MKSSSIFSREGVDTPALQNYLLKWGFREHETLKRCRLETEKMGGISMMQIAPDQGAFLGLLVRLMDARQILEIGVFTGYSSLSMALALPEGGRLTACDISEEYVSKARLYWKEAGVLEKIDLRLAPAIETLDALLEAGRAGSYDMAFIDADKGSYDIYYEKTLSLLRAGGLIAIDNVLWAGRVADESDQNADTLTIRAINEKIHKDARVDMLLLPIADGVTLCRKR